jgi:alpha-tubulin suppressor-like RCC1 family protein
MAGKTIVNIAVGFYSCMALSSEGRVYAWGYNNSGALGDNSRETRSLPVDVSTFGALRGKRIVAIASTSIDYNPATSYALDSDGALYAWGHNGTSLQLGNGVHWSRMNDSLVPVAVNMSRLVGKRVVAITAGWGNALIRTSDGLLFGWGNNGSGEIDYTAAAQIAIPTPVNMSGALTGKRVAQVDMGHNHAIVLTTDGLLVGWGTDGGGEMGDGPELSNKVGPVLVASSGVLRGKSIASISADEGHCFAIATDGTLFGWGYNYDGALGRVGMANAFVPIAVNFGALVGQPVKSVSASRYHGFAITGLPGGGTTPTPTPTLGTTPSPTPTPGATPVTPTRPANDARTNGIAISGSGSAKGTNVNATGDFPDSAGTAPNVWWTYTAAQAGFVTFSTTGSGFDSYLNIYDATGRLLGVNDNSAGNNAAILRLPVVAGQKLHVSVSGVRGAVGTITLSWSFTPPRPAHLGVARYAPVAVQNGSIINYTIVVMNSGDLPLNNVSVAQNINTDKTLLIGGLTLPAASEVNAFGVIWRLGTIAGHSSRTLRLQVRAKDNNPFGTNIALGNLSVTTSNAGSISRTRRMINIESSLFLIGNVVNALRSVGDAIGSVFSYVFSASVRDQRAKADLGTVRSSSHLLEVAGLDVLQLNRSGAIIIPIGGNNVVAVGGANVVAAGGANVVAAGGANVVAVGGANVVAVGGANVQTILSNLLSNPASVVAAGGANVVAVGGANVIAAGGGNLFAPGSNVAAVAGARLVDNASGAISTTALRSLTGGAGVVAVGGANVNPALNGAGVVAVGGANLFAPGGGNVVAVGGANVVAVGGANVVAVGGAN